MCTECSCADTVPDDRSPQYRRNVPYWGESAIARAQPTARGGRALPKRKFTPRFRTSCADSHREADTSSRRLGKEGCGRKPIIARQIMCDQFAASDADRSPLHGWSFGLVLLRIISRANSPLDVSVLSAPGAAFPPSSTSTQPLPIWLPVRAGTQT
jgi:hypothetical protein